MGFLDNTSITVDAILTKKGREKLASGTENFKITKYAFADDEIDYALWDTSHPNGSTYYGAVLDNMPILEAFVDETQVMRYKLFTANKDLPNLSYISLNTPTRTVGASGGVIGEVDTITPATNNFGDGERYHFQLLNTDICSIEGVGDTGNIPAQFTQDGRTATVKAAKELKVQAKNLNLDSNRTIFSTVCFITGQTTGATFVVTIQNNTNTSNQFS